MANKNEKYLYSLRGLIYSVFKVDVKRQTSKREVVDARRAFAYIARTDLKYCLRQIGEFLGKDHATVLHYKKTHLELYQTNRVYRDMFDEINPLELTKETIKESYNYHLAKARYYADKLEIELEVA